MERYEGHGAAELNAGRLEKGVDGRLRPHHRVPGHQIPRVTGLLTNCRGRPVQCTALRLRFEGEVSFYFEIHERVRFPFINVIYALFCPDKLRSFEPAMCLDLALER